jgi:hypothetical protein
MTEGPTRAPAAAAHAGLGAQVAVAAQAAPRPGMSDVVVMTRMCSIGPVYGHDDGAAGRLHPGPQSRDAVPDTRFGVRHRNGSYARHRDHDRQNLS